MRGREQAYCSKEQQEQENKLETEENPTGYQKAPVGSLLLLFISCPQKSSYCTMLTEQELWDLFWKQATSTSASTEDDTTIDNGISRSLFICLISIITTWIVSTITAKNSQVDKLWSILPAVYACTLVNDTRTLVMAVVATIWAARLTFNFARRGGYQWPPWKGDEDYRWLALQQGKLWGILRNKVVWHVFNFIFISVYQNILLWLIAAGPSVTAHLVALVSSEKQQLEIGDWICACLVLVFIGIETIADNQQYAFQSEKYKRKNDKKQRLTGDYKDGFLQRGLFRIVRKPNYAAEQAIWICYYGFAMTATKRLLTSCAIGWILLVLLFVGSGDFTERLTVAKYPEYANYQKRVPLYVPLLHGLPKKAKSS